MIVTCEGCETSFHVGDGLVKPTGSKVRCSKCRHVFTAYAPAQEADAAEPLTLTDELQAEAAPTESPAEDEIGSELDALFAAADAEEFDAAADAEDAPELLNVDELADSTDQGPDRIGGPALEEEGALDLDLDLDIIEDGGDVADAAPAEGLPPPAVTLAESGEPGGESELDLDMDLEPLGVEENAEALPPELDELEIDLDELGDLAAADASIPDETQASAETGEEEIGLDFDLESLELEADGLGSAEPAETAAVADGDDAGAGALAPGDSLDESDLDLEMETGADIGQPAEAHHDHAAAGADELDLSDLEEMLEGGEAVGAGRSEAADEPLELDLKSEILPEGLPSEEPEELDLAAITADLDAADPSAPDLESVSEDLDLDFLSEAGDAAPETVSDAGEKVDELDFSGVADSLGSKEGPGVEDAFDDQDLELLFEEEPAGAPDALEAEAARDSDEPILDIETLLGDENKAGDENVVVQTDDMEIEIEPLRKGLEDRLLEDPADAAASATETVTDDFATDEFTDTGLTGATDILEPQVAAATASAAAAETAARSGVRKPLMALAAVLLLAVAALVVPRSLGIHIPFLSDIEIPLIGDLFKSEPQDPLGNLKLAPLVEAISAEFIDNQSAGRLCVIKGQVRNDYDHPRSHIQVTAKLYTKDKAVTKSATVFAGNMLSKAELASLDLAAISARTGLKTGANNVNIGVPPGKTVPFMVVLDKLPADADEYSVEVAGSTK